MNKKRTAPEIRQAFLDFFKSKGHEIVASSPVVLPTDPTLLFTNAGMNPFKDIFLGARDITTSRVADTQKCIRVSGKHNDLEEVGHDTYHHTFFEMLGNWSFGDYYKREAISWAWELLTDVWGLPKERLWATVYREDEEAEKLWREVTDIAPERVLRFDEKDNFWEMGETGPCGPCSEIHIDLSDEGLGPEWVNKGSPEVIELWNLVFIQHNRRADGSLEDLPLKHVDTGMGFERLVAVLQSAKSNYDTDVFQPILNKICELSGCGYEGDSAIAMRVIADHLRALSFAIADGVMPSNEGRGYVLRRLLRRAVRYGRKIELHQPFMADLFPILEDSMGDVFPELKKNRDMIVRALTSEEKSFAATLDRGINLFDEVVDSLKQNEQQVFPGSEAFKLYDTYGFPLDLTELMAAEQGLSVDAAGFDALMASQKERARAAGKDPGASSHADKLSTLITEGVRTEFLGYDALEATGNVLAIIVDGKRVNRMEAGQEGEVLLDRTPFYGESGGQIGDAGSIYKEDMEFEVDDTQKPVEGIFLHIGRLVRGGLSVGDTVSAKVYDRRRRNIQRNHTATHLLNFALRELVNPAVKQAGSLVAPDRLRFDFNHFEAVPEGKLEEIENLVNQRILDDEQVDTYEMAFRDVPDSGIVAVFDEKYGDTVRVLDIGGFSKELCGGTHVRRTGEIGLFRIVSESSVAAGIRRIEAVTGWPAIDSVRKEGLLLRDLARQFSATPDEVPERVSTLMHRNKELEKELREHAAKSAESEAEGLLAHKQEVRGVCLIARVVGEQNMQNLRTIMDRIRASLPHGVIVLGSTSKGKACFMAAVPENLVGRGLHAGKLVGEIARIAGGGGGGQPTKAQAGGKDAAKVPAAIEKAPAILESMLG